MLAGKHKSSRTSNKPKHYNNHNLSSNRSSGSTINNNELGNYIGHMNYGYNISNLGRSSHGNPPRAWSDSKLDHWSYSGSNKHDEAGWLREVTRCAHFERDHYCKELTNCPFFHEGIDCIRFFTRKPCTGNSCKFKHRVIFTESFDGDKDSKGKRKDSGVYDYKGKEAQREEAETNRDGDYHKGRVHDVHKDKSFYSKSKPIDEFNKKRAHHSGVKDSTEATHENSKRRRTYESASSRSYHHEPPCNKEEFAREDDRRALHRSSGGLEISLPPYWKAAWSKQGEIYYYNTATGERTWDLPVNKPSQDAQMPRISEPKPKDKQPHKKQNEDLVSNEDRSTLKLKQADNQAQEGREADFKESEGPQVPASEEKEDVKQAQTPNSSSAASLIHNQESTGVGVQEDKEEASDLDDGGDDNNNEMAPSPPRLLLRPDAVRVFASTTILTHLLRPSLREMVVKLQQQSINMLNSPHKKDTSATTPTRSTTSQKSTLTTSPKPIFTAPHSSGTIFLPIPTTSTTTPTATDSDTALTCLRCSTLPTTARFTQALLANLRNYCCPRCVKQMDQELIYTKISQLHVAPSLYDRTMRDQALLDSIAATHTALLNLYKKTKIETTM